MQRICGEVRLCEILNQPKFVYVQRQCNIVKLNSEIKSPSNFQNVVFSATYIAVTENSVVSNQIVLMILSIVYIQKICNGFVTTCDFAKY
jgi:hypothetical protein